MALDCSVVVVDSGVVDIPVLNSKAQGLKYAAVYIT
jgi:hypothetical protein